MRSRSLELSLIFMAVTIISGLVSRLYVRHRSGEIGSPFISGFVGTDI
jgi:hypothetical protein